MRLRLVASGPEPGAAEPAALPPLRLPPGRHGLPPDMVRANQRQRLLEAAAIALAENGFGRITVAGVAKLAGISTRTFYEHFEDLWACLLAAHEVEAAWLLAAVESAWTGVNGERRERGQAGVAAALDFLAAEPGVARLLCAEPPPQIAVLTAARREFADRLGAMLRHALNGGETTLLPGLERRLIGAALALVATRAASGDPSDLVALEPELSELLLATL